MTYQVRIHENGDGTLSESKAQVSDSHCMHFAAAGVLEFSSSSSIFVDLPLVQTFKKFLPVT
jgi:hypothetical protein